MERAREMSCNASSAAVRIVGWNGSFEPKTRDIYTEKQNEQRLEKMRQHGEDKAIVTSPCGFASVGDDLPVMTIENTKTFARIRGVPDQKARRQIRNVVFQASGNRLSLTKEKTSRDGPGRPPKYTIIEEPKRIPVQPSQAKKKGSPPPSPSLFLMPRTPLSVRIPSPTDVVSESSPMVWFSSGSARTPPFLRVSNFQEYASIAKDYYIGQDACSPAYKAFIEKKIHSADKATRIFYENRYHTRYRPAAAEEESPIDALNHDLITGDADFFEEMFACVRQSSFYVQKIAELSIGASPDTNSILCLVCWFLLRRENQRKIYCQLQSNKKRDNDGRHQWAQLATLYYAQRGLTDPHKVSS